MANTFTGLKLQGELGKFGQTDLSDISCYIEFPDGKILSGTEYGVLLLWEGIFIKTQIYTLEKPETLCHENQIEYMEWEDQTYIVTGGRDGFLKWWNYNEIENAVIDDFNKSYIKPFKEVQLINSKNKTPVKIITLIKNTGFWLVQDGNGFLLKVYPDKKFQTELVYDFLSGPIVLTEFINNSPYLLAQGSDSKTFLYNIHKNFNEKIMLYKDDLNMETTACDIYIRESDEDPLIVALGYKSGLFKILEYIAKDNNLQTIAQHKSHEEPIQKILFSPDSAYLITATKTEIFFFIIPNLNNLVPKCFIKLEHTIVDVCWQSKSEKIMVGLSNGSIEEIMFPKNFSNAETFHNTEYEKKVFKIKMTMEQIEKKDEKKRAGRKRDKTKKLEEPDPAAILSCRYSNLIEEGDFLVTAVHPYNEFIYLCSFNSERPIKYWTIGVNMWKIQCITQDYVFLSNHSSIIHLHHKSDLKRYVEFSPNALSLGNVSHISMSQDQKLISTSYKDGTIITLILDGDGFSKEMKVIEQEERGKTDRNFILPNTKERLLEKIKTIQEEEDAVREERERIEQEQIQESLENAKRRAEEQLRLRNAEKKKNDLRQKIFLLADQFKLISQKNEVLEEELRLEPDEMIVDETYLDYIRHENNEVIRDIKHNYDWQKENIRVTNTKIEEFFLNSLQTPKIYVYSLDKSEYVTTLRCAKLPDDFEEEIAKMETLIEELFAKIDIKSLDLEFNKYTSNQDSKLINKKLIEFR